MYRVLCLLVIVSAVNTTCWHWRHPWHRHRHHLTDNDPFEDITEQMSRVDEILKSACDDHLTTEAFDSEKFVITHQLPEYKVDYIDVVIKNRVIQTTAKKAVSDKHMFRDLRILPNNLDISGATWNFVDGNVTIRIPFAANSKEFCVKDDQKMKLVPKEIVYDLDVRFNDEIIN